MVSRITVLLGICLMSHTIYGQGRLDLMAYNLLDFPLAQPAERWDTLRNILNFYSPDLLMVCELRNEYGADQILDEALNYGGADHYRRAIYQEQQSGSGSFTLQQLIFYDSRKLGLVGQEVVTTQTRDINVYYLYLKGPGLDAVDADTVHLAVYVTHLKASQGSSNEWLRNEAAEKVVAHMNTLPDDRLVLLAGDLNVYGSTEDAYQTLLSPSNDIVLKDPVNAPGAWHANSSFAELHTQCTRESAIFGTGAGGGVDDRFDFILLDEDLTNGNGAISYQVGSYAALGNNGNCYNDNITDCQPNTIPAEVLSSLYYMSDHLPVVLTLDVPFELSVEQNELPELASIRSIFATSSSIVVSFEHAFPHKTLLNVYDLQGKQLYTEAVSLDGTKKSVAIPQSHFAPGMYIATLQATDGSYKKAKKFVLQGK